MYCTCIVIVVCHCIVCLGNNIQRRRMSSATETSSSSNSGKPFYVIITLLLHPLHTLDNPQSPDSIPPYTTTPLPHPLTKQYPLSPPLPHHTPPAAISITTPPHEDCRDMMDTTDEIHSIKKEEKIAGVSMLELH